MRSSLLLFLFSTLLSSCSNTKELYNNFVAVNALKRGDRERASLSLERTSATPSLALYDRYNRGFLSTEALTLAERWASLSEVKGSVGYKAAFNSGVYYYMAQQYEKAEALFKRALLANPESEKAKINLEITLLRVDQSRLNERDFEQYDVPTTIQDYYEESFYNQTLPDSEVEPNDW